jgi:hypothetical protein
LAKKTSVSADPWRRCPLETGFGGHRVKWLQRRGYRGRHRGQFADGYRSPEAFAEFDNARTQWAAAFEEAELREIAYAYDRQVRRMLGLPIRHAGETL